MDEYVKCNGPGDQLSAPQFVFEMQMLFSLQLFSLQNDMKSHSKIAIAIETNYISAAQKHRIVPARFQKFSFGVWWNLNWWAGKRYEIICGHAQEDQKGPKILLFVHKWAESKGNWTSFEERWMVVTTMPDREQTLACTTESGSLTTMPSQGRRYGLFLHATHHL